LGSGPGSRNFEQWWPAHGIWWAVGFAALYVVLFWLNELISSWASVVEGRISLLFLPAFAKVAAVVVSRLAGLVGLFSGGFLVGLVYGEPFWAALSVSCVSTAGVFLAYWILLKAMRLDVLPMSLPVLVVLTVLYAPLNAILHAFAWEGLGMSADITAIEIGYMMIGDLLGVVVMFLALRAALRFSRHVGLMRRV
jgi:hypothetical protein